MCAVKRQAPVVLPLLLLCLTWPASVLSARQSHCSPARCFSIGFVVILFDYFFFPLDDEMFHFLHLYHLKGSLAINNRDKSATVYLSNKTRLKGFWVLPFLCLIMETSFPVVLSRELGPSRVLSLSFAPR